MPYDLFSQPSFGASSFSSSMSCELFASGGLLVREETGGYRLAEASEVLEAAQRLLLSQVRGQPMMSTPQMVRDFLMLRLGGLEYEVFAVLHLNSQHCVIDYAEMFRGTLTQTSVYPREIVKESLARNTASVVLVHNHPSGIAKPSRADEALTATLKAALSLVDVRVLDHFVVAGPTMVSMAELGLL